MLTRATSAQWALSIILLTAIAFAKAEAANGPTAPRAESTTSVVEASDASVFTYSHFDKTCLVWNDGCRTCLNSQANGVNCSNVGFACQIKPISCDVRRPK